MSLLKKLGTFASVIALSAFASAQQHMFTPLTAVGATQSFPVITAALANGPLTVPSVYTIQPFVVGLPTSCKYHVYGTIKLLGQNPSFPSDYADLSGEQDCSSTGPGIVHIPYRPVSGIVVSLTALSGGTNPSVTFGYLGTK